MVQRRSERSATDLRPKSLWERYRHHFVVRQSAGRLDEGRHGVKVYMEERANEEMITWADLSLLKSRKQIKR